MRNLVKVSLVGIVISFLYLLPFTSSVPTQTKASPTTTTQDSYLSALVASKSTDQSQSSKNSAKNNRREDIYPVYSGSTSSFESYDYNYQPSTNYASPTQSYGPPSTSYGSPHSSYGPPPSGHSTDSYSAPPPSSNYGGPYFKPSNVYGPASPTYSAPPSNPHQTYGPPSPHQTYEPHSPHQTYGPPATYHPPGPIYIPYGPPPQEQSNRGSIEKWLLEKLKFKLDFYTIGKIILKLIIFKKMVKFFAIICLLLFLPTLKKKIVTMTEDTSDHHDDSDEERVVKNTNASFISKRKLDDISLMLTKALQAFAIQTLACDDEDDASLKCRFFNIFNELSNVKNTKVATNIDDEDNADDENDASEEEDDVNEDES